MSIDAVKVSLPRKLWTMARHNIDFCYALSLLAF